MGTRIMKAIFVNHCHPEKQHVCATRMKYFSYGMAARGHKILLLTEALDSTNSDKNIDDVVRSLESHDWSGPFVLPIHPHFDKILYKTVL